MKCMLFKTKKRLLIEFMKLESTYLHLFCEVNDLIDEEGIKYRYHHETSFEVFDFMSKRDIIDKIKYYKRWINIFNHVLTENKRKESR